MFDGPRGESKGETLAEADEPFGRRNTLTEWAASNRPSYSCQDVVPAWTGETLMHWRIRGTWCAGVMLASAAGAIGQCDAFEKLAPPGDSIPTYGGAIAVSGEWAAIGASQDYNSNGGRAGTPLMAQGYKTGSVFIRRVVDGRWVAHQTLRCPLANEFGGNEFGASVAIAGETLLIGSPGRELPDSQRGEVYAYDLIDGWWRLAQVIQPEDTGGQRQQAFGSAVAIEGDTAVIGGPGFGDRSGALYFLERTGGVWRRVSRLSPDGAARDDGWGSAISLSGATLLAGAKEALGGGGAAVVVQRLDGVWTQVAQLRPSDTARGHNFGLSVRLEGDEALVSGQHNAKGRVYVFQRRFGVWEEVEVYSFTSADGVEENHRFGSAMAIDGDVALFSAPLHRPGNGSGSFYIFYRRPEGWVEGANVYPLSSESGDQFAHALALHQGIAFVQARVQLLNGAIAGEAWLFQIGECRPTLEVDAACPEGGTATISWRRAAPRSEVALFIAPQRGRLLIPPGLPCAGFTLDLDPEGAALFYRGFSGANGGRTIIGELAPSACGQWMQLLNIPSCLTSPTVPIE